MASFKTYTSKDLIASAKKRCNVPVTQITFTDEDILTFANEALDETVAPMVLSVREEFYVVYEDITLVQNQRNYPIPYRALGSKIRILKPLHPNNNSGEAHEGYPLVPIPLDQQNGNQNVTGGYNNGRGYYIRNDEFILGSDLINTGIQNLRLYYYLRPNDLVTLSRASKIRSIDFSSNTVTVENVPNNINSSVTVDLIQHLPNYKIYDFDMSVTVNAQSKVIVFADSLPEGLQVGDYVCLNGETVCPQLPVDVIPVLEQVTACKILEAQGDSEGLKNANVRLDKMEKAAFNLITNRIESPGKKINNVTGLLRRGRRRTGFW